MPGGGKPKYGHALSPLFKEMYEAYFPSEEMNTNSNWIPDRCCDSCFSRLEDWYKENRIIARLNFITPMLWPLVDPPNHDVDDCYGCVNWYDKIKKKSQNLRFCWRCFAACAI